MRIVMLTLALALTVLPRPAAAQAPVEVQVRQVSAEGFELNVVLPPGINEAQAQASLLPVAQQVCEGRGARLGHYRFETQVPLSPESGEPGSQTFIQQVDCVAGTAEVDGDTGTPAPKTPPSDDDKRRVTEQTLAYLAAKDRGDFTAVRALIADEVSELLASKRSEADRKAFNAAAGEPEQRQVVRLTWYDDPAGAPRLGRYAAADYRGDYAHEGFYCGYAVWYLQPDGQFRIVRIEEGVLSDEMAKAITPAQMANTRTQLGCRD